MFSNNNTGPGYPTASPNSCCCNGDLQEHLKKCCNLGKLPPIVEKCDEFSGCGFNNAAKQKEKEQCPNGAKKEKEQCFVCGQNQPKPVPENLKCEQGKGDKV